MYVLLVPFYRSPIASPSYEVFGPFKTEDEADRQSIAFSGKYCIIKPILGMECANATEPASFS